MARPTEKHPAATMDGQQSPLGRPIGSILPKIDMAAAIRSNGSLLSRNIFSKELHRREMASIPQSPIVRSACLAAMLLAVAGSCGADNRIQILRAVPMSDRTVMAIRFDHASGLASQVMIDRESGKVLQEHTYAGRPQSSSREFQDAVCLIGADPVLRRFIAQGALAEGGFIVDGPSDQPLNHRYIQIRLLSPDRRDLLQVVLVDLTAHVVASARSWFE
jgi:hypothetical protein